MKSQMIARALVGAVVACFFMASPAFAYAGPGVLDLPAVTSNYLVTLRLGPPGKTLAIDDPALTSGISAGQVVLCTTDPVAIAADGLPAGTHHLEVHVVDRRTWRVIDQGSVSISILNVLTGLRATVPAVRMLDPTSGINDVHFGDNVFTPDAHYHVTVIVQGEPAEFDFIVRSGVVEAVPDLETILVGRGIAPAAYLAFGLAAFVVILMFLRGRHEPPRAAPARWLFVTLLLFQGFHEIEHVVQVVQAFVLHIPGAAGILGSVFGLEPVHFAYNTWFLALGTAVLMTYGARRDDIAHSTLVVALMALGVGIQSYHVVEHVAKISQFLDSGLNGVPGLLGRTVNPIWLHYTLNTVAYAPFAAAFVISGLPRVVHADVLRWSETNEIVAGVLARLSITQGSRSPNSR